MFSACNHRHRHSQTRAHTHTSVKLNSILFVERRDFCLNDASSTSTHNTNMHSAYWNFCYGCCRCRCRRRRPQQHCRRRKSRRNLLFAQPKRHVFTTYYQMSTQIFNVIGVCECVRVSASLCIQHLSFSLFLPFSLTTHSRFCSSNLFS